MSGDGITLERFLRVLPGLDIEQLLAISAAHDGVDAGALARARGVAGDLARAEGSLDELHDLHATIIQWAGSQGGQSRLYTREGLFETPAVGMLHDVREQARPALLDAATALFLEARLQPEDRDALLGPVDSVIG
jgi:hypothetical protein